MERRNKRQRSIKPITEFIKYFHIPINFIENREKKKKEKRKNWKEIHTKSCLSHISRQLKPIQMNLKAKNDNYEYIH